MTRGVVLMWLGVAAVVGVVATIAVPRTRAALMGALPPTWSIAMSAWRYGIRVDHDVVIAMPDGVRLGASLYRPRAASGPLPTVLVRLPYDRLRYSEGRNSALFFAQHGYAAVVQDLRGTGSSGGELLPWRDAASDGVAMLDWIASQPWSNGKVGTFGCSALGETQFVLAARNHPAHRAMIASGAGGAVGSALGRGGYFGVFEGGVFQLASAFGWFAGSGAKRPDAPPAAAFDIAKHLRELPVSALVGRVRPAPNGYTDFLAAPLADPAWASWGYLTDADRIDLPALVINTWGDQTVGDALAWAEHTRLNQGSAGAARQKVVIAPGNHCQHEESGERNARFGELELSGTAQPWRDWYLRWFDQWLSGRGDGLPELPAYTYFMLVENRWRGASQWPPLEAREQRWYLGSHGRANSVRGTGFVGRQPKRDVESDGLRYDPIDPVPSRGGPVCCTGDANERPGPVDQADVEKRDDVLVYSSDPLQADLRIAGPLKLHLSFSTDVPDTDLVARLTHVWPDGRSTNIQEGALRLRYRRGLAPAPALQPGAQYEVDVDMRSIGYMVPRGHRLRLHVTSSSFPRLERNLNGPGPNADATVSHVASSRVHYGNAGDASYVMLPVLDASP
jgi:uncharacterized protein